MSDKVYCIVQFGDFIYIPVKAEKNPYNGEEAYLKGLPNFFGGTKDEIYYEGQERKEKPRTPAEALSDELREESRNYINVSEPDIAGQITNENMLLNMQVAGSQYWFGLISIQTDPIPKKEGEPYMPQDYILDFYKEFRDPSENEMKCILKVPITDVIKMGEMQADIDALLNMPLDKIADDKIDKFANKVLSACSIVYEGNKSPQYFLGLIQDPQNQKVHDDWNASETRKAFAKLAAVLYSRYNK